METYSPAPSFKGWSFTKTERAESTASSVDLSEDARIRIQPDPVVPADDDTEELQDRYLSSEEDLSPLESDDDDDDFDDCISLGESEPEIMEAEMVRPAAPEHACIAVRLSFTPVRPKMIELPRRQLATPPLRTTSLPHTITSVVPLLKTPQPKKRTNSAWSTEGLSALPAIPARSKHRPSLTPHTLRSPPTFLSEDPSPRSREPQPPTPPLALAKATRRLRGLTRSNSVAKRVVDTIRKTSTSPVGDHHSPSKPKLVAREPTERPPVLELSWFPDGEDLYDDPARRRMKLQARTSVVSLAHL